jgi:hypothetical protein
MKPRVCYISNFYLGERRVEIIPQKEDRLLYLKHQILTLSQYKHNLSKIFFNFNLREEDVSYINEILALTPKQIQNTPVEITFRKNKGFSYGAWSDIFVKHQDEFDYYIFNEDDCFVIQNNWDEYLVEKFNTYKNCGYFCGVVYEETNVYPTHAAHAFGISSFEALNKVYQKYGRLLGEMDNYTQQHIGGEVHNDGQVAHTLVFKEFGYDIYDIREKYRVLHSMGTSTENSFFELYFDWNQEYLVFPAAAYFKQPVRYYFKKEDQFLLPGINKKYEKKDSIHNTGS